MVWFGVLFAGVVDGQNVWRTDLDPALDVLTRLSERGPVSMTTSCSLLHAPHASENEPSLANDPELRSWLSFGKEKVQEVALLGRLLATSGYATAAYEPEDAEALARARSAIESRRNSTRTHNSDVRGCTSQHQRKRVHPRPVFRTAGSATNKFAVAFTCPPPQSAISHKPLGFVWPVPPAALEKSPMLNTL